MKRILAVLLALALMLTLTPAALADESAAATDPVVPAAQPGTLAHTISLLIERIRVLLTPDLAAKAELAEFLDEADRAALNAASSADVATEVVAALRDQGMGYGQIALIDILARASGKEMHGQAKQAHAETHQQSHGAGEQHPAQHGSSGSGPGHGKGGGKGTR